MSRLSLSAPLALLALSAGCAGPQLPAADPSGAREPYPGSRPAQAAALRPPAGGAAPQPAPAPVSAPAAGEVARPAAYAARFNRQDLCESGARSTLALSRDKAWEVLKACIDKGGFTLIKRLLDGAWDHELKTKPDAAQVLARVVASRGGDVYGDLNLLRSKKVPVFGLAPAMANPEVYRGRMLMVRMRVDDMRTEKGKVSVQLSEFALEGQVHSEDGKFVHRWSSRSGGSGKVDVDRSYGSTRARGSWETNREGMSSEGMEYTKRMDNKPVETGLRAVARIGAADPFFEPGRQFIILARFDGLREVPSEDDEEEAMKLPVLSIVSYVEPSAVYVE